MAAEDDNEINLRDYWLVIRRRQHHIAGLALLLLALLTLCLWWWPASYQASSTIMVESKEAKVVSIEEVYDIGAGQTEYLLTQYEVLKSRELAEKVIAALDLIHHPEFNPASQPGRGATWLNTTARSDSEIQQDMLQKFAEQLDVKPVRNTQLVTVTFTARDPQLAADILNTLGKVYIENDLGARLDITRQAAGWINSRLAGLREQLEQSEQALQDYREQENLLEVEGVRTLVSQELNELTTKLVEARRKRTEAENRVARIGEDATSNPAVLEHPLVQRLREQEALAEQKLSELSKRYGPQHPKIIAVTSELEAAHSSYNQQVGKVIEGVRREYEIAKATEESLDASLEKMKREMQDINRKEYKLSELERTVQVNRELYDTFFSRMKETTETENLQTPHARIIDRAMVPTEAAGLPRWLLWLLAALSSVLVATGLVLLLDKFDTTLNNPDDVRNRFGETLLGILPLLARSESTTLPLYFCRQPGSAFAESVRTIRTALLVSARQHSSKVVLVTSALPGEGKSVLASNLAAAMGQMGRTLLIDADLRRPSAARNFSLPGNAPGLSALLAGTATASDCIRSLPAAGMDVLPAGAIPANPLELLSLPAFAALLASLQQRYDHIIIDSAPCEAVSDALVLSMFAEAVIYVVQAGVTDSRIIHAGIQRLREAGAPLRGVVLNRVDIEKGQRAGYYYGGYYNNGSYHNRGHYAQAAND